MDSPSVGAMHFRKRTAQSIDVFGHQDQVDMVGHQHPAPHRHSTCRTMDGEQIAIGWIVTIVEEGQLPPIAALGDVMRDAGKDKAGETGHDACVARFGLKAKSVHCHRNTSTVSRRNRPILRHRQPSAFFNGLLQGRGHVAFNLSARKPARGN